MKDGRRGGSQGQLGTGGLSKNLGPGVVTSANDGIEVKETFSPAANERAEALNWQRSPVGPRWSLQGRRQPVHFLTFFFRGMM